jgi:hypothetical protein
VDKVLRKFDDCNIENVKDSVFEKQLNTCINNWFEHGPPKQIQKRHPTGRLSFFNILMTKIYVAFFAFESFSWNIAILLVAINMAARCPL